jgi:uncharacterized membrane protein
MSKRFLVLLLVLAALLTAATYSYTIENEVVFTEDGLADLTQVATVHGWPWGYYAEVLEWSKVGENQIAIIEYNETRGDMLIQTFAVWFVVLLLVVLFVGIVVSSNQQRR